RPQLVLPSIARYATSRRPQSPRRARGPAQSTTACHRELRYLRAPAVPAPRPAVPRRAQPPSVTRRAHPPAIARYAPRAPPRSPAPTSAAINGRSRRSRSPRNAHLERARNLQIGQAVKAPRHKSRTTNAPYPLPHQIPKIRRASNASDARGWKYVPVHFISLYNSKIQMILMFAEGFGIKKSHVILENYTFNDKFEARGVEEGRDKAFGLPGPDGRTPSGVRCNAEDGFCSFSGQGYKVLMEPVVLNCERAATDQRKRMPVLFDDYRDEDFYGLPRKYSIVARVEVKFPIEPRFRDRQHFVLSDINGAKIEAITYMYETVKHFDNFLHEKHVYKMHNVKFSLHPGEFNFRHLNGPMELCLDQQTIVEPYTVPIQMAPFPKQIILNLADIAELPNRTLVDIMAIVVHLDTIHRTMWGPFRKIVIMDARGYLHIIKAWGDLLNKNALRWALAKEDYGIIIGTMFRGFRRQECLESSDHTAIHFNSFHHNTHHFG
ncbi:hypothetical protein ACJX0J_007567, partial [Zea mays]